MCVCVCDGVGGGVLLTSVGLFERVDETRVPAEFLHEAARVRQETVRWETVSRDHYINFFLIMYFEGQRKRPVALETVVF